MALAADGLAVDGHPVGTLRHYGREMRSFAMTGNRIAKHNNRLALHGEPILSAAKLLPASDIESFDSNAGHRIKPCER